MKPIAMAAVLGAGLLTGCSCNNTEALKEHTADATAAAKRDAGAIASGIVEGLERKGPLDINSAPSRQLEALPGMTSDLARAVVEGRPYGDTSDLVHRHVLSRPEYNRIRAQIVVKK